MSKLTTIFSSVLAIPESDVIETLSPTNTPSWDSLNAIILLTEIEKAFQLKFAFDEAMGIKTFGDVIQLVSRRGGDPYA